MRFKGNLLEITFLSSLFKESTYLMDTKTLIAFALMILIYFYFFQPVPHPENPVSGNFVTNSISAKTDIQEKTVPPVISAKSPLAEKTYWLRGQKFDLEVDTLGSIKKVIFKTYFKTVQDKSHLDFSFAQSGFNESYLFANGQLVDWNLVGVEDQSIKLGAQLANTKFERSISIGDSYNLNIKDTAQNNGTQSVKLEARMDLNRPMFDAYKPAGFFERIFHPQSEIHEAVIWMDGSIWRNILHPQEAAIEKKGVINWSGFSDKYFFYGFVPQNISIQSFSLQDQKGVGFIQRLDLSNKVLVPGESAEYTYSFYAGPKEIPELRKTSPELGEVVDYGSWIGPISRLLLMILHFFYSLIPNYGIGIILLTLLVKSALYPLSFKSAVSMRRLQLVQPKMKELRDRYKDDKARLNTEIMALYKQEKVNPLGGCLPILIQMPVFFALYRVFFASIEFRHAEFFGWIKDLSHYDPYFVTPVLMTALMWYQTKITPQPPMMEENEAMQVQRAMMKWMPVVFGAIMIFLPAGLTLYFLVNALLSLIQQLYINRFLNREYPLPAVKQAS